MSAEEHTDGQGKMRLNRYLALCGAGSRRAVETFIRDGRVRVDGNTVTDLATLVEPGESVDFDGKAMRPPKSHTYLMFNKPPVYLCSRSDPQGKPLIYDLLPAQYRSLHYMGRLDFLSRGLIVMTNDGALTQCMLHPSFEVPRTYRVVTCRPLNEFEMTTLTLGVELETGEKTLPAHVELAKSFPGEGPALYITLKEGKNREVRRMLAALNHGVIDLQRVAFAGLALGDVPEGGFRELTPQEVRQLHVIAHTAKPAASRTRSAASHGSASPSRGKPERPAPREKVAPFAQHDPKQSPGRAGSQRETHKENPRPPRELSHRGPNTPSAPSSASGSGTRERAHKFGDASASPKNRNSTRNTHR